MSSSSSALPELPSSCVSFPIALTGVLAFVSALYALRFTSFDPVAAAVVAVVAYASPIVVLELTVLRSYGRASTGLEWGAAAGLNVRRIAVKLLGLYGTFALLAALYWMIPDYHRDFYRSFFELVEWVWPYVCAGLVPYVIWIDGRQRQPEDGYYHAGLALLGRWSALDRSRLWQYVLSWLIKGFFMPLMFVNVVRTVAFVRAAQFELLLTQYVYTYNFLWESLFLIDTAVAMVGYSLTLRVLDSHIRSSEPTVAGWAVALMCYEPFWNFFYTTYFPYDADNYFWGHWLQQSPRLYALWGGLILVFLTLYVVSHSAFGIRFSNLTHRGVITSGLYRYTKHPAYVAKNVMWWLVAVPFVASHGWLDAVRDSVMLAAVNLIYYARARTEERHLSWDPTYVQYALAMNQRSIFAPLARVIPALRYRAPEHVAMKAPID